MPYVAKPFHKSKKKPPSWESSQALLEAQLRNSPLSRGVWPWRLATANSKAAATVKTEQVGRAPCSRGASPNRSRTGRRSTCAGNADDTGSEFVGVESGGTGWACSVNAGALAR